MADVDGRRWILIEDGNSISNNLRYFGEWHLDSYGLLGGSVQPVRRVGSFEAHNASTVARVAFSFEGAPDFVCPPKIVLIDCQRQVPVSPSEADPGPPRNHAVSSSARLTARKGRPTSTTQTIQDRIDYALTMT